MKYFNDVHICILLRFCTEAAFEIGLIVFEQSLKLYTPLYLLNQGLFQRKFDRKTFEDSFRSIIRSSLFLSGNASLVSNNNKYQTEFIIELS